MPILHPPSQTQSISFSFCFPAPKPACCVRPETNHHHCHTTESQNHIFHPGFKLWCKSLSPVTFSMLTAGSCPALTWAELFFRCSTLRWGKVGIQRDWGGEGPILGENLVNKVGSSSFQPAASFLCAQPLPREGNWGSRACKEDKSLAGFLQTQAALYQREEKLQEGTSKAVPKCSLQELDLRLSPLEEEGEKGRRNVK